MQLVAGKKEKGLKEMTERQYVERLQIMLSTLWFKCSVKTFTFFKSLKSLFTAGLFLQKGTKRYISVANHGFPDSLALNAIKKTEKDFKRDNENNEEDGLHPLEPENLILEGAPVPDDSVELVI